MQATPPPGWEEGLLYDIWRNLIFSDRWRMLLNGLGMTFQITIGAILLGLTLGLLFALMRTSKIAPLRWFGAAYVTVVRGIPLAVQLLMWWFIVFAPTGLSRELTAIIAFGINSGAYSCEIFRGGILSVDHGQTEAGRSVGLSSSQNFRLVILPQAFKNALPPLSNELITLFKQTSIVGFIGIPDLTRMGDFIRSRTFNAFVPLMAVALTYLVIVIIMTWLLGKLERRLRRSDSR
jgi:His/Glu/Gln/Arg/opine family amino acid ABC transporter permease subunit